jgi:hypothetical protein
MVDYSVTAEALSGLERELNRFKFRGIRVGSLITSHIIIDFLYRRFDPDKHIKESLRYYYVRYLPKRDMKGFSFGKHRESIGKPMLTFISDRRHLFEMPYPIYEELGPDKVFCLLQDEAVYNKMKIRPIHYSFFDRLPQYNFSLWRKEFSSMWKKIKPAVLHFVYENSVDKRYLLYIRNHLLGETKYILSFDALLRFLRPRYILTEADRYAFTAPLILSARALDIPAFTMMHGIVANSIGYTPILADKIFVWGERQKVGLIKFGARDDQIVITGAPQLDCRRMGSRDQLIALLDLPRNSRIVVLATNPIGKELRMRLFHIFCEAMRILSVKGVYGFVKIHPSEELSFYTSMPDVPVNVVFDEGNAVGFEGSLVIADIVCNYNSAYALDALIRGIPVVTINIDNDFLGEVADLIGYGQLPAVVNSEELSIMIAKYFEDKEFRDLLLSRSAEYASKYCCAFGKEAAKNIIDAIHSGGRHSFA